MAVRAGTGRRGTRSLRQFLQAALSVVALDHAGRQFSPGDVLFQGDDLPMPPILRLRSMAILAILFGSIPFSAAPALAQVAPNYQDPAFLQSHQVMTDEDLAKLVVLLGSMAPPDLIPVSKAEGKFIVPGKMMTAYHVHVGDPGSDAILGNAFAVVEGDKLWAWHHFGEEPWVRIAGITPPKKDRQSLLMERRTIADGVETVDLDVVEIFTNMATLTETLPQVLVDGCLADPPTGRKATKVMFGLSGFLTEVVDQPCP
jgi:hypothetical protein